MSEVGDHLAALREALDELETAAEENVRRGLEIQDRLRRVRADLDAGVPLIEQLENEPQPPVVGMITANMTALERAGARFRAAQAQALRSEGLTMDAIAEHFGVTRQRISALLKQKAATKPR